MPDKCCPQCTWLDQQRRILEHRNRNKNLPYLICGMNYEEAEQYCEHVTQHCNAETGYCAKDEVNGG